jgi:hypothetical protein
MKNSTKRPIVVLSDIDVSTLDKIIAKFSLEHCNELWVVHENKEINKWTANKNYIIKNLQKEPIKEFNNPNNNFVLSIAEPFFHSRNCYFVYTVQKSDDNYLLGAIFHLSKLLKSNKTKSINFGKEIFELYLYFRESKFICANNYNPICGVGWDIDYTLIKKFNLNTGRKYMPFFKELIPPLLLNNNIKILEKSSNKFYPISERFVFFLNFLFNPIFKLLNSINILKNILAFRWRRYKKRFSKS